nr:hypothetical protein [Sinirhodobacter populi]
MGREVRMPVARLPAHLHIGEIAIGPEVDHLIERTDRAGVETDRRAERLDPHGHGETVEDLAHPARRVMAQVDEGPVGGGDEQPKRGGKDRAKRLGAQRPVLFQDRRDIGHDHDLHSVDDVEQDADKEDGDPQ